MFRLKVLALSKALLVAASSILILALSASTSLAGSGCKKVSGKFSLTPVTGASCNSPVGICAAGAFKGDITGASAFTGSGLFQTVDTPSTSVVLLTGDALFQLAGGTLFSKDAITFKTNTGEFAELDTIISGAGAYQGASGVLQAVGTYDIVTGGGGDYTGTLCTP